MGSSKPARFPTPRRAAGPPSAATTFRFRSCSVTRGPHLTRKSISKHAASASAASSNGLPRTQTWCSLARSRLTTRAISQTQTASTSVPSGTANSERGSPGRGLIPSWVEPCLGLRCSARIGPSTQTKAGFHPAWYRSEEHTSELQSHLNLVCRLLLEKKNKNNTETCTSKRQTCQETTRTSSNHATFPTHPPSRRTPAIHPEARRSTALSSQNRSNG